jgi:hypothetical protein
MSGRGNSMCMASFSNPSLIRLQLIRIEIWKMKNSAYSWVHTRTLKGTWYLGARRIRARELSGCVEGSWRDWNHARKYPRLTWAEWKLWFQLLIKKEMQWYIILLFIFISTAYVIKFSIYLFSNFPCLLWIYFTSLIRTFLLKQSGLSRVYCISGYLLIFKFINILWRKW